MTEKKKPCRICTSLDEFRRNTPHDPKSLHTDTREAEAAIVALGSTHKKMRRVLVGGNATAVVK